MTKNSTTRPVKPRRRSGTGDASPGLLVVFSGDRPLLLPLPCGADPLVLGRDSFLAQALEDPVMSRQHFGVSVRGATWLVRDLGSKNGTFVDGRRVDGEWVGPRPLVISAGQSLLLTVDDLTPFIDAAVEVSADQVVGPRLAQSLSRIAKLAASSGNLHIVGESGAGKELAARAFHAAGSPPESPFIAVNCAAVPESLAETLFFGARKGAYSGATDAKGYLQAASGGTLFLDEVAELPLVVQAKLLRALESGEVVPVGATAARQVELRVVTASHRVLVDEVAAGRFREDLFYRIGRPSIELPPLRQRTEEIPFLIRHQLARARSKARLHVSFVEACLLRSWPGNVRELLREVTTSLAAVGAGELLEAEHLDAAAGMAVASRKAPPRSTINDTVIEETLRKRKVISVAARELGMHSTQLHRWLAKHPEVAAVIRKTR